MKFTMKCRIDTSEIYNNRHTTVVTTPAPDSYSQPSSFKVFSDSALGAIGNEVELDVSVRGFVREKRYKDKNTGQEKVFQEDNVFLDASLVQMRKAG